MVGLLLISSLLEGVSIVLFLPMLGVLFNDHSPNAISKYVLEFFEKVGIEPSLITLLGLLVCLSFCRGAVLWLSKRQVGYAVIRIGTDLRLALVRALQRVQWSYFVRQKPGTLANSLSFECETASNVYFHSARTYAGVISLVVNLCLAALVSWQVSLVVIGACLVGLVGFSSLLKMAHSAGVEQNLVLERVSSFLVDFLNGFKPLKSMGREALFSSVISREVEELNRAKRKEVLAKESLVALQEPFSICLLAVGVAMVHGSSLISGSVLLVVLYLFYKMMSYFSDVQQSLQNIYRCRGVYESLMSKIYVAEAQAAKSDGACFSFEKQISFKSVGYSYGKKRVLSEVSFDIPMGSFSAIVGRTGEGKTTLVDILSGLIAPSEGQVCIDGLSLADLDQQAWREMIGYVPQEVFLFNDTIHMNVALGEVLTDDDIWHALKLAGIEEHVRSLPEGLHSQLGEQGRALSGGQRQRIMIARALARRPSLLILDEATTGLDEKTEKEILDSLTALKGEVTVLAISHQPALRKVADQILTVGGGTVRLEKL